MCCSAKNLLGVFQIDITSFGSYLTVIAAFVISCDECATLPCTPIHCCHKRSILRQKSIIRTKSPLSECLGSSIPDLRLVCIILVGRRGSSMNLILVDVLVTQGAVVAHDGLRGLSTELREVV